MRLIMPTADAERQTLEVSAPDVLNKIFDQVVRSNMRMQDMRNRVKDMQDDIRVMKRHLKIEDVEGEKRMKFAIDPTQGRPGDYAKEDFDWTKRTLRLGSEWSSNMSTQREVLSDVKPKALWPPSDISEPKMAEDNELQDRQGMKGMASNQLGGTLAALCASYVPYGRSHTPDEAASDPPTLPQMMEEALPNDVEVPVLRNLPDEDASDVSFLFEAEGGGELAAPLAMDTQPPALEATPPGVDTQPPPLEIAEPMGMIIFEGESEPDRLDQLSWEQEMVLENGCYYRYYIENEHSERA